MKIIGIKAFSVKILFLYQGICHNKCMKNSCKLQKRFFWKKYPIKIFVKKKNMVL